MAKKPSGKKRVYKVSRTRSGTQTATPQGLSPEELDALSELIAAEEEILDALERKLIDYDEAVKRQKEAQRKYGEKAGLTMKTRQVRAEQFAKDADTAATSAGLPGKDDSDDRKQAKQDRIDEMYQTRRARENARDDEMRRQRITRQAVTTAALVGNATQAAAAGAQGAAQNSLSKAALPGIDAAANALMLIPGYGQAFGLALKTGTAAVKAFNETVAAFVARGKELRQLNPQIAQEAALADVRQLMTDMREANRLGPDYAKLIQAQSKLDENMANALMEIKAVILPKLADAVNFLAEQAKNAEKVNSKLVAFFSDERTKAFLDGMEAVFVHFGMAHNIQVLRFLFEKHDRREEAKLNKEQADMLFQFDKMLGMAGQIDIGGRPFVDPAAGVAADKVGIPILDGGVPVGGRVAFGR